MWLEAGSIVVALLTGAAGLFQAWRVGQRYEGEKQQLQAEARRLDAEAGNTVTETFLAIVRALRERMDEQDAEIDELRSDVRLRDEQLDTLERQYRAMRRGVQILVRQIRDLGHEPLWTPPNDEE